MDYGPIVVVVAEKHPENYHKVWKRKEHNTPRKTKQKVVSNAKRLPKTRTNIQARIIFNPHRQQPSWSYSQQP